MSLPEFGFDPRNPGHLEKSLIGTALLDPEVLELPEVRALQPHHFAHYGGLWQLTREVHAAGNLGLVALAEHEHDPRWPVGMTLNDLASLDAYSLQPRELPAVARGVLSSYRSTEAHRSAAVLARTLTEPEADALGAITATHARLGELLAETPSSSTVSVADDLGTAIDRLLHPAHYRGVTTGLSSFDAVLGGWQPRTLNILAARPSMGKSAIVGQFAQSAALGDQRGPGRVLMFSLEDGALITRQRTLSRISGVDLRHDAPPMVGAEHRLQQAAGKLEAMRRYWMIDEESSLEGIVSACWREHAAAPLDLIIVDQLSHVRASAPRGLADNRTQLYGYITKTLKQDVAKRLGVPVLLVSQLSREVTKRGENRPDLPDLRDSGELEQDADTVTFIHRPDYYDPADCPGQAELIVRKNRNGPVKTVHLNANLRLFKFEEAPR